VTEVFLRDWSTTLTLAGGSPLHRVAALVSACARLSSSIEEQIAEASAHPDLKDRIDIAARLGRISNPLEAHRARDLRNDAAHDAKAPSREDALRAVCELAIAELGVLELEPACAAQLRAQYQALVGLRATDLSGAERRFDLAEPVDVSALRYAACSEEDADRSAAILVACALLGHALDGLISAVLPFGDERKGLLDLTLKPKLSAVFERGWIVGTDSMRGSALDAITARNHCAHEDLMPALGDTEGHVAAVVDVARLASRLEQKYSPAVSMEAPAPRAVPENARLDTVPAPSMPSGVRLGAPESPASAFLEVAGVVITGLLILAAILVGHGKSEPAVPAACTNLAAPAAAEFPECAVLMQHSTGGSCAPERFAHHTPQPVEVLAYCAELKYDEVKRLGSKGPRP
jgi:hypothetical protein